MKKFTSFIKNASAKTKKGAIVASSAVAAAGISMTNVFANDFIDKLTNVAKNLADPLIKLLIAAGIAAFIVAAIIRAVSKNPRTADEATEWMKRIAVAVALGVAADVIINWIQSIMQ